MTTFREGSAIPNDMYSLFYDLRAEVAQQVASDPERFTTSLAEAGLAKDEAAGYVRDLLQQHFDHPGTYGVTPEDSAAVGVLR